MKAFADAWPDEPIVQAPLAQITWYHNLTLLEKMKSSEERLWYAQAAIEHRLEPEHPRDADQGRALSPSRKGTNKFHANTALEDVQISVES